MFRIFFICFKILIMNNETSRDASFYTQSKNWGWYNSPRQLEKMLQYCKNTGKLKILEIGAFDGVSANIILDLMCPHPDSQVHTIDPYLPDATTPEVSAATQAQFEENYQKGGHAESIFLYNGISAEVLAWMAATEGFWESYDLAYIDGSHRCADVFIDAALCWHLMKPGSIIVFDDYNWKPHLPTACRPKAAIDSFQLCFEGLIELLWEDVQIGFRKLC